MRSKQLFSLLAAMVLLAACETAGTGSAEQSGAGGQAGATQGTGTGASGTQSTMTQPTQEAFGAMLARVGDRVFFDFDKADLKPEARATIQSWAEWLKNSPTTDVIIEGHADERGTREYNLALGERRATAIKNYLVALGVDPNRIRTISYGKERPAVPGHNEEAWAQNRRGVLVAQ